MRGKGSASARVFVCECVKCVESGFVGAFAMCMFQARFRLLFSRARP
jgi:hypothetical protein